MKLPVPFILHVLLIPLVISLLPGCKPDKPVDEPPEFHISTNAAPPNSVVMLVTGETGYEGAFVTVFNFPGGDQVKSGPLDEIRAAWSDGILVKAEDRYEWYDWDFSTNKYVLDDDLDLSLWQTPMSVDPEQRLVYALGLKTPPARELEVYYLNGRSKESVNSFIAEIVEDIPLLPSNAFVG